MNKNEITKFTDLSYSQPNQGCGVNYQHKQLSAGRWFKLRFLEQMANVGSEVTRAILWKKKNNEYAIKAIERALELLDLTIADIKNRLHLKELTRLREALIDYFYFDNQFFSSDELWQNYFYAFSYATRNCACGSPPSLKLRW